MRFRTKFKCKMINLSRRKMRQYKKRNLLDLLVSIHKSSSKRKQRKILKIPPNYRHRLRTKQHKKLNRSLKKEYLRDLGSRLTGMSQINNRPKRLSMNFRRP